MIADFAIARYEGGWRRFQRDIPEMLRREWAALPAGKATIQWMRECLDDDRFEGHAMIWKAVE